MSSMSDEEAFKQALAEKIAPTSSSSSSLPSSNTVTYYGMTLRYLTPQEKSESGLEKDDVAAEVQKNGRFVLFDQDEKRWFYLGGEEELLPDKEHDYGAQTYYNFEGEATVVPLSEVDTVGMGNRQQYKLDRINIGIKYGMALPPISVTKVSDNSYRATNGFNRVIASKEKGFTHIPVVIAGA